jgi:hypothetical protein
LIHIRIIATGCSKIDSRISSSSFIWGSSRLRAADSAAASEPGRWAF